MRSGPITSDTWQKDSWPGDNRTPGQPHVIHLGKTLYSALTNEGTAEEPAPGVNS